MDPVEDNGEYSSSGGVNMDGTKLGGGGESDGGMFSNTVAPTTDQGLQNEVHDTGGNWEHTYNEGKQKNNCDTFSFYLHKTVTYCDINDPYMFEVILHKSLHFMVEDYIPW